MSALWDLLEKSMLGIKESKDESNRAFDQAYQMAMSEMRTLVLNYESQVIRRPLVDGFAQTESSLSTWGHKLKLKQCEEEKTENNNDTSAHDEIAVLGTSFTKSPTVKFGQSRRNSNSTNDISPGFKMMLKKKREEMLSHISSDHGTALVETEGTQSEHMNSSTYDDVESLRDDGRVNLDYTKMVEPLCELSPPEKSPPEPIIQDCTEAANATQTLARSKVKSTNEEPAVSGSMKQESLCHSSEDVKNQALLSTSPSSKLNMAFTSDTGYPNNLSPELKQVRDQKIHEIRLIAGTESNDEVTSPSRERCQVEADAAQSRSDDQRLERSQEPCVKDKSLTLIFDEAGTVKRLTSSVDGNKMSQDCTKRQSASGAGTEGGKGGWKASAEKVPRVETDSRVRQRVVVTADPWIKAGILPQDFGKPKHVSKTSTYDEARYNSLWETKQSIGNGALTVRKLKPSVIGTEMKTGKDFIDHIQECNQYMRRDNM